MHGDHDDHGPGRQRAELAITDRSSLTAAPARRPPLQGPSSFLEILDDAPRSHQAPLQDCEASRLRSVRSAALAARGGRETFHPVRIVVVPDLR